MDVFKAFQEFTAPASHVLSLRRGERIDVLEPTNGRHRQEWWAARRIRDNELGFVPSKYLEFDEFISLDYLPADFEQQREVQLRQLAMMERAPAFPEENNNLLKYGALRRPKKRQQMMLHSAIGAAQRSSLVPPNTVPMDDMKMGLGESPTAGLEDMARLELRNSPHLPIRNTPSPRFSPVPSPRSGSPFFFSQSPRNSPLLREDIEGWHEYNERSNSPPQYLYPGPQSKNLSESEWQKILDSAEGELAEPEPDYGDEEDDEESNDRSNGSASPASPMSPAKIIQPHPTAYQSQSDGELHLPPKKLVNPVVESRERMALHRELMMNQRRGVDVLNKKSELKKVLEKRTEEQKKKEYDEYMKSKKTVLQKKLEEQAEKMKPYTLETLKKNGELADKSKSTPELHEMSPKVLRKTVPASKPQTPSDEDVPEFLRVHTKIYKNKAPTS